MPTTRSIHSFPDYSNNDPYKFSSTTKETRRQSPLAPLPSNLAHYRERNTRSMRSVKYHGNSLAASWSGPSTAFMQQKKYSLRGKVEVAVKTAIRRGRKRKRSSLVLEKIPQAPQEDEDAARVTRSSSRRRDNAADGSSDDHADHSASSEGIDDENVYTESEDDRNQKRATHDDEQDDDYLLNNASSRELLRMRKDHLLNLCFTLGSPSDSTFESTTKDILVNRIIKSRRKVQSRATSSSRGSASPSTSSRTRRRNANALSSSTPDISQPNGRKSHVNKLTQSLSVLESSSSRLRNGKGFHSRSTSNSLSASWSTENFKKEVNESESSQLSDIDSSFEHGGDYETPVAKRTRRASESDDMSSYEIIPHPPRLADPTPVAKRTRSARNQLQGLSLSTKPNSLASNNSSIDSNKSVERNEDDKNEATPTLHRITRKRKNTNDTQADSNSTNGEKKKGLLNEEDEDLIGLTVKDLMRLRRYDLEKLCKTRYLHIRGKKNDLVNRLLKWRDQQGEEREYRPDSEQDDDNDADLSSIEYEPNVDEGMHTPILLRSRFHEEKPPTPIIHNGSDEILDLESLNLLDKHIAPDKLTKTRYLGSGHYKDVYIGIYRNVKVAVADFRGQLKDSDIKELEVLRDLKHENIVRFIGVSIPLERMTASCMLVTELCLNGDLFDYIRDKKVQCPGAIRMLEIMRDIAQGMEYLHTRTPSIIHRDLKSSNILVTANGVAKINDFGVARVKKSVHSMILSLVGTVNYQAPELWAAHPRYNEKVDVYSAGMVYWEILTWPKPNKQYPFQGMNEHAIYEAVKEKGQRPSVASMGRRWGRDILNLIENMWDQDPAKRPSMIEVLKEINRQLKQKREEQEKEKEK